MEAATVLEITPEFLRQKAQAKRDEADGLRDVQVRLRAEAVRLDNEADALEEAERIRRMTEPPPNAKAVLAGEVAAYLARCRSPKAMSDLVERFDTTPERLRQSLDLLIAEGIVYRSGLKRGTRYRVLKLGEEPPPAPFSERWHEHVRDVAIELGTFTTPEIVERIAEVSPVTVARWLAKLVEDGVLSVERVGNTNLYAYERPEATPDVLPMIRREDDAPRRRRDRAVAGTGRAKLGGRRDVAAIIRVAKAAGAEIKPQKHGYAVVVEGEIIGNVPRTPSDHRSLKNAEAKLRRNGGA